MNDAGLMNAHMVKPEFLARIAENPSHMSAPAWLRLWALAMNRATRDRHAEFVTGELVELLGITRRGVQVAIRKAGGVGLILWPLSGERCIRLAEGIHPESDWYGCSWCLDGANPRRRATNVRSRPTTRRKGSE